MNSVLKKRPPRKRNKTKVPPESEADLFWKNLTIGKETKSAPWNWATDNERVDVGQWSEYRLCWKKIHHSSEKYIFRHLVSTHLVPLCVTLAEDLLRLLITKREKKRRKFFIISQLSSVGPIEPSVEDRMDSCVQTSLFLPAPGVRSRVRPRRVFLFGARAGGSP